MGRPQSGNVTVKVRVPADKVAQIRQMAAELRAAPAEKGFGAEVGAGARKAIKKAAVDAGLFQQCKCVPPAIRAPLFRPNGKL